MVDTKPQQLTRLALIAARQMKQGLLLTPQLEPVVDVKFRRVPTAPSRRKVQQHARHLMTNLSLFNAPKEPVCYKLQSQEGLGQVLLQRLREVLLQLRCQVSVLLAHSKTAPPKRPWLAIAIRTT